MGFFSWKTADSKESIYNVYSKKFVSKPVYLLQPYANPIKETAYQGYGVFGNTDAYTWLAKHNLGVESRELGCKIAFSYLIPIPNSDTYIIQCDNHILTNWIIKNTNLNIIPFKSWKDPISAANNINAIAVNEQTHSTKRIYLNKFVKLPIKLSFNAKADYHALNASEDCEHQGFF